MSGREESAFLKGEIGVDGVAVDEAEDEADVQRGKAVEAMARNRAYLGREFLTWLLFRSNDGEPIAELDDEPITLLVVGKVSLRGLAGEATELAVKGHLSAYSDIVRHAIDRGLLVHTARLRVQHGERIFEVTLDAEFLDFRAADIPKVLSEEADDQLAERLWLCERLGGLMDALWDRFMTIRSTAKWSKEAKAIKAWAEIRAE